MSQRTSTHRKDQEKARDFMAIQEIGFQEALRRVRSEQPTKQPPAAASEPFLAPGQTIRRPDLHGTYGGRLHGRISPSKSSPHVFLFTSALEPDDPYGALYDGWSGEDGYFHFVGEGQTADQRMAQGNKTIRDHLSEQRDLRLFALRANGQAHYIGEFRYIDHQYGDAPDMEEPRRLRTVIIFRLEIVDGQHIGPQRRKLNQLGFETVKEVPIEEHLTELEVFDPQRKPTAHEKKRAKLIRALAARLFADGHQACRLQFRPEGEPAPLFCDVYDRTTRTLIQVKGTVIRDAMREAIGELHDYERLIGEPVTRTVLMPERPRADLIALAHAEGVTVMWPEHGRYTTSPPTADSAAT
jgi:hypothetical protein